MQFKPINREWVKNAAIVFLAVLLVLTFFSNTIMNRTLPEVATQYVTSGTVTARVRGTGTVVANGSHQVKAESTREIRSVMVRVGQEVNAGDVLFILGEGDADDLDAAQEQLRQLQISYQRAAINSPTFNYSSSERKLQSAYDAYQAALEVEKAAKEALENGLNIPDAEREQVEKNLKEAIDTYNTIAQRVDETRAASEKAVEDALHYYNELRKAYGLPEVNGVEAAMSNPVNLASGGGRLIATTLASVDTQPSSEPTVPRSETTTPPSNEVSTPPASETKPDDTLGDGQGTTQSDGPTTLTPEQEAKLKDAQQKLADAQMNLDTLKFPELEAAQNNVDRCQSAYDEMMSRGGSLKQVYDQAVVDRQTAEEDYLSQKEALDAQKESDNKSQALAGLDMADIAAQIERQKKIIEELAGGDGNQVLANVSGTVESIECTAGDTVMEDGVLCTIEVPDMGYTLSFSVTNDQARRLSPGDTASVTNYYWGSQINATLSTIRVDPEKPQTNKLLTFDLDGDVSAGSEITLSVGQRSAGYDTIVPNSAIRSDSNGSFVLIVESKSSPLGNRYIARRVDVEVLAADDINSAVTGDLSAYSYVITTSNAPVNNGDMVRMADT